VEAFFRVIPTPKRSHPSLKGIFLPLDDIKKLEAINLKVQKNVMDDEIMDNDIYTQEMSYFFSTAKIITGCIFKMEDNSFSWMYEIELNKQY
jgi:hypothetical protein